MTVITATLVSALRETTGAPLMKCKAALIETEGNLARAEVRLREQGVTTPAIQTEGNQGYIAGYIHPGSHKPVHARSRAIQ